MPMSAGRQSCVVGQAFILQRGLLLFTAMTSLSGAYSGADEVLATVPVTATVVGTLLMIYPASTLMGRLGRRGGFMFKAGVGVLGGAICATALLAANFALLIAGTFLLGIFSALASTIASPPSMRREIRKRALRPSPS